MPFDYSQAPAYGTNDPSVVSGSTMPKKSPWDFLSQGVQGLNAVAGMNAAGQQANASNLSTELANRLADAELKNRMASEYHNQMNTRTAVNSAAQGDAWNKLRAASFVNHFDPKTFGPNLDKNPYFSRMAAPNADLLAGAKSLQDTSRDALMSGQYTNNGGAPLPAINAQPSTPIDPRFMAPPKEGALNKALRIANTAAQFVPK